ncbi:hypothetical protein CesoFtcFv8_021934 [Champsocephalus esox]|uniref:Uncharacterized protein n=1 Tax=Champsocephalus esox TaxID=159716 RepID=A0AAN8BA96_9TELE|nr:hypothetical protein CesoFtcFv8_021934 [Champsocephalus esox]
MERDNLSRALQSAEACLKVGEKSGQDPTEEYTALKNSYLALADAHDKEQNQGEKLSAELLALAQAQDALRLQLEEQQQSVETSTRGLHCELDRVRALISSMSHNRVKLENLGALDKEQNTLLGNQDEIKDMLEKMKNSYEEQQKKLEEKVVEMGNEHQEDEKRATRKRQQELSERSAAPMCSQSQVKEAEEENSKLQLQVKELNEEYRLRLVWYLRDLPREQILAPPESRLDPGPPEAPFSLEPSEIREETERELQQRRQDEAQLQIGMRGILVGHKEAAEGDLRLYTGEFRERPSPSHHQGFSCRGAGVGVAGLY